MAAIPLSPSSRHSRPLDRTVLADWLPRLAGRWRSGELTDPDYAAAYFLVWQIARHGPRFASRTAKSDPRPDPTAWLSSFEEKSAGARRDRLICFLDRYQFLGIISNVPAALVGWLRDGWPLRLCTGIPAPLDVLAQQAAGYRPVTVVGSWPRAAEPVLAKADGCHFLVHDLEHAYKFCQNPNLHQAQRRLFGLLLDTVGMFEPYRADPVFAGQFDYLISDMNTHPVHSLRFLVAVLIEHGLRRDGRTARDRLAPRAEVELDGFLRSLCRCWKFDRSAEESLLCLLMGEFGPAEARRVEAAVAGT